MSKILVPWHKICAIETAFSLLVMKVCVVKFRVM